ncbi:hypothetical protein GBA63_14335 [Rubrobacter tropicus]|uniref:Lipoprotein n=1 Tax=Rubrobacter tropicus TaxID=2653851 RepID=A0A6G8QB39_9ACTN|nr:hypothetical protein [Rubrobacter tropicus]QIN83679.1 hypothetical protein GBA63_14335 [Rubrobacter tropicus]
MLGGIARSRALGRVVLTVATILPAVSACGAGGGFDDADPRYASERERLLATCPARAQAFFAWQQELAEGKGLERPVDENDLVLDPTANLAQNHLLTLPDDQRGGVVIDSVRDRVIVQVTRGEDEVLADLREKIEDPETVAVETVRWSEGDLSSFARRIEDIPGSDSWGYGFGNANGRIEVDVPGDANEARRKIAGVIDPCAFTVRGNAPPMRPE